MEIAGSVAIVTGGASGLGEATVRKLHAAGATVVIIDLAGTAGELLVAELGERTRFLPADVTSSSEVEKVVTAASSLGPLRILVNCAGIGAPAKVLGKDGPLPLATFEKMIAVNLIGTFNVLRLAAFEMAKTELVGEERGIIINTASVAAFDGQIGQPAYAASKGAIVSMTLPIARELARDRIRVMTIAPGLFHTPMLDALPEAARESLGTQVPNPPRLGLPAEYAELVSHLIANPYLNGETIRLDGAIRMGPR